MKKKDILEAIKDGRELLNWNGTNWHRPTGCVALGHGYTSRYRVVEPAPGSGVWVRYVTGSFTATESFNEGVVDSRNLHDRTYADWKLEQDARDERDKALHVARATLHEQQTGRADQLYARLGVGEVGRRFYATSEVGLWLSAADVEKLLLEPEVHA